MVSVMSYPIRKDRRLIDGIENRSIYILWDLTVIYGSRGEHVHLINSLSYIYMYIYIQIISNVYRELLFKLCSCMVSIVCNLSWGTCHVNLYRISHIPVYTYM